MQRTDYLKPAPKGNTHELEKQAKIIIAQGISHPMYNIAKGYLNANKK